MKQENNRFYHQRTIREKTAHRSGIYICTVMQGASFLMVLLIMFKVNIALAFIGLMIFDTCEIIKQLIRYKDYKAGEYKKSPVYIIVMGVLACFLMTLFTIFMVWLFTPLPTAP